MQVVYLITEVIFGFLGGALLMRVYDVTHSMKVMAKRQSEVLLKSNLENFEIGWNECYQFVMQYRGLTLTGLRDVLTSTKDLRSEGAPAVHRRPGRK